MIDALLKLFKWIVSLPYFKSEGRVQLADVSDKAMTVAQNALDSVEGLREEVQQQWEECQALRKMVNEAALAEHRCQMELKKLKARLNIPDD